MALSALVMRTGWTMSVGNCRARKCSTKVHGI